MSDSSEAGPSTRRQNPLIWIALVVIGLIVFVFLSGERGQSMISRGVDSNEETAGTIERNLLVPPGMRAREYIDQLRDNGKPYPLDVAYDKAEQYLADGSLADAHLLYFFAAREDYLPAIMKMAEMSDPTIFRAQDSLLDHADVIQAYKWYRKAADLGHQEAIVRIDGLHQWALAEADAENPHAKQFLLNFQVGTSQ